MNSTLLQHVQKKFLRNAPEIRPGYTVRVHQRIKEGNKERVQIFEGLVLKVEGSKGTDQTITVRKIVSGIGVEKVFPLHTPSIEKIEITKKAKIRRAKLYYMRERSGKSARLKEQHLSEITELDYIHKDEPAAEAVEDQAQDAPDQAEVETTETAEAAAETPEAEESKAEEQTEPEVTEETTETPEAEPEVQGEATQETAEAPEEEKKEE